MPEVDPLIGTTLVPPPEIKAANLGSRRTFFALLAAMAASSLVWPWRRAVSEDFAAGAVLLTAAQALLTIGSRREIWRKVLSPLLLLAGLACFVLFVKGPGEFAWARMEVLIAAGLGAACSAGAAYLGPWGNDKDEVLWARALAPVGAVLLAVAAATWATPEDASWSAAVVSDGGRIWRAWSCAGGLWRWGGLLVLAVAAAGVRRLKIGPEKKAADRTLNWNR